MKKRSLTVLAFVVATFGTQAPSHFLVFADHYAAVTYIRKETLFQFGVLAMLIQGVVLSVLYTLYTRFAGAKSTMKSAGRNTTGPLARIPQPSATPARMKNRAPPPCHTAISA